MNEEELYKLAISDVPKYPLLNEILAIRDKRFPDEETDYTINVYGSISLDVLNKYVETIKENQKLKHILDELEKWAEEGDKESLHIPYECELDYVDVLDKIKELRGRENE